MRVVQPGRRSLFFLALASLGIYLALSFLYPLAPSLADPRGDWLAQAGLSLPRVLLHLALYLGLTLLYTASIQAALRLGQQNAASNKERSWSQLRLVGLILCAWFAFSLTLLAISPVGESHDIFDYVFRGRMMVEYQANPLAEIPKAFDNAPFYLYVGWYDHVDTYGPVWEMTSAGVALTIRLIAQWLGWWDQILPTCPDSTGSCRMLALYLGGYRLLAIGLAAASAGFIAALMRRHFAAHIPAALVIWLWNPLTLFSTAVGGHNDLLLIVLLLASLRLMQSQRFFFAIIAVILAAHVKLTAFIWAPVFGFWILYKKGFRRALFLGAAGLLSGAFLSWLLYLPFGGWGTLPRMLHERSLYYANSIWKVLYKFWAGQPGWMDWAVNHLTNTLPNGLFLAGALLIPLWIFGFLSRSRAPDDAPPGMEDSRLWYSMTLAALCYLMVGAFWFQHWYILWVLAPAALLPFTPLPEKVIPWLGFGALSANFLEGYLVRFLYAGDYHNYLYLALVIIIWLPGLIAYLGLKPSQRRLVFPLPGRRD